MKNLNCRIFKSHKMEFTKFDTKYFMYTEYLNYTRSRSCGNIRSFNEYLISKYKIFNS